MLGIDLTTWLKAYDYKENQAHALRSLDQTPHIVSQIPFPANFPERILLKTPNKTLQKYIKTNNKEQKYFDFSAAFKAWELQIKPRNFYDTTPLVKAIYAEKHNEPLNVIEGINYDNKDAEIPVDFSHNSMNKAVIAIREAANQDKVLLQIASKYWDKFCQNGIFKLEKKHTVKGDTTPAIFSFFDAKVYIKFKSDDRQIEIEPNDVNRPILSTVHEFANEIAEVINPDNTQKTFAFYRMLEKYREIQAEDRFKRLKLIKLITVFEKDDLIPKGNYKKEMKPEENRKMEFTFYQKAYPTLTFEEYNIIVDARNKVYHRGANIKIDSAIELVEQFITK